MRAMIHERCRGLSDRAITMERYDVGIIGAGPAGLFCAIQAASAGHRILVLEKMFAPGRKLLITGSGQCNITHEGDVSDFVFHYGEHGKFLKPALLSFTNNDLMTFFDDHGLHMESREDGKVFPVTRRSVDVLSVLLNECSRRGIDLQCDEPVVNIIKGLDGFEISTSQDRYYAEYLVIATGGVSYPETGSDGDGYRFAAGHGHTIADIAPALTPLIIKNFPFVDLSGISFSLMPFSVWRAGKKMFRHVGDVLLTYNGLSGPGILDCSRNIEPGDEIRLSFTGSVSHHDVRHALSGMTVLHGTRQVISIVRQFHIPDRLAKKILDHTQIPYNLTGAHLAAAQRKQLIKNLTEFPLNVEKLGDFSCAMVTRGGVKLGEVNAGTMESRIEKNLFFAGEVLDIDGDSGGYNLQAAFSTGMLAAQTIKKRYSSHH
jgi:predicted Rossmann fold flavoprotein